MMDGLYIALVFMMALLAVAALFVGLGCQFFDGWWGLISETTCGPWPEPEPTKWEKAKDFLNNL